MSTIRKYHNHTLQPNQPNLSDNSPKLHRVDPSTNSVFSKLDSLSLDSLSLFNQIENNMQIKSLGNLTDPPPSSEKSQMAEDFLKNTGASPPPPPQEAIRFFVSNCFSREVHTLMTKTMCQVTPRFQGLFSCLTQLSTKFQLLIKTKIPTNEEVICF